MVTTFDCTVRASHTKRNKDKMKTFVTFNRKLYIGTRITTEIYNMQVEVTMYRKYG